jgi:hypothetical protein
MELFQGLGLATPLAPAMGVAPEGPRAEGSERYPEAAGKTDRFPGSERQCPEPSRSEGFPRNREMDKKKPAPRPGGRALSFYVDS